MVMFFVKVSISKVTRLEGASVEFPCISHDQSNSSLHDFIPKSPAFGSAGREESEGQQGVVEKAQVPDPELTREDPHSSPAW